MLCEASQGDKRDNKTVTLMAEQSQRRPARSQELHLPKKLNYFFLKYFSFRGERKKTLKHNESFHILSQEKKQE